jgi:Pentapeptide repeats (8 copies)
MLPEDGQELATRLREKAARLLESDVPEAGVTAAGLLKTASDLECQQATIAKLNLERHKLEQDLRDSHQFWRSGLVTATPLITSGILACTLVFQVWQGAQQAQQARASEAEKQNELLRQEERAEQTRFTEALKTIGSEEKISSAAILLNSFTNEPQKSDARKMVLRLLLSSRSKEDFEALFSGNIEPITFADFPSVVQLNRALAGQYGQIPFKVDPLTTEIDYRSVSKDEKARMFFLSDEIQFVSGKIVNLLRLPRAAGSEIDLDNASIMNVDMKGVDLHGASLSGISFTSVNLEGCNLSDTTRFDNARFFYTPWWRAARMSKPLLDYLQATDPFRPGVTYAGTTPATAKEYQAEVERLKAI